MRTFIIIAAGILLIPSIGWGKSGTFGAYVKSGRLINTPHLHTEAGGTTGFTQIKNTWQGAAGVNYTYTTKQNILLFAGVEGGYEQYKIILARPTDAYTTLGADPIEHNVNTTIYNASVQVGVGYKFTKTKLQPEVRLGAALNVPINSKKVSSESYEVTGYGNNNMVFLKTGAFGNGPDLYNSIYAGIDVLHSKKIVSAVKVGLQYQQRLFVTQNLSNYLAVKYFDANGSQLSTERFYGQHSALSLVVGVVF